MAFVILDCEQRSDAWKQARCGRVTGSRACDFLATLKGKGEAASRRNYRVELVLERLLGKPSENSFSSRDLERGVALEPEALLRYEGLTGTLVRKTGFLQHTDLLTGASLDGDVDEFTGIVEAKAPRPGVHLEYLRSHTVPGEYAAQIQHALWLTGAQWGDFLSYCPDFPEPLDVCLVRMVRNEVAIAEYETALKTFLQEVDTEMAALRTMANLLGVLEEAVQ